MITDYPTAEEVQAALSAEGGDDNWRHRADNMRCRTCMWYVPKYTGQLGRCRHHSPTMKGYPAVFPTDWCGDHKLDEEKI